MAGSRIGDAYGSLLVSLEPKDDEAASTRCEEVRYRLERAYWGIINEEDDWHSTYVGSKHKGTQISIGHDYDILFFLPPGLKRRMNRYKGNRPSRLLQTIKEKLKLLFPHTTFIADGPSIICSFPECTIDLIPAFVGGEGSYELLITSEKGFRGVVMIPQLELRWLLQSDTLNGGNTRELIKIVKCWKYEKKVKLKSFAIELMVIEFMDRFHHVPRILYTALIAEFFNFTLDKSDEIIFDRMQRLYIFTAHAWIRKAWSACKACNLALNCENNADPEGSIKVLQKVFGPNFK